MSDEANHIGDSDRDRETEQGFTPGPWAAFEGLLDDWGIWIMSAHVEDAVVASIGMNLREAIANARLIAAAPALYEALKESAIRTHTIGAYHSPASVLFEKCDKTPCVKARAALNLVNKPADESAKRPIEQSNG